MAISFKNTNGSAIKNSHEAYTYKDNENIVRLVGGVLPRYIYWIKSANNKQLPVECLSFDREQEKFLNSETDHVPDYYPDLKCSWAYTINCIDPADGKVKVLNLKKKLFAQICSAAEDMGLDPTDPDEGFDVVFKRVKTGPLAYNVEYTLSQLKLKKRALTDAERQAVAEAKTIDEKFPRPTPAEIKTFLDKIKKGFDTDTDDAGTDQEAVSDLNQ